MYRLCNGQLLKPKLAYLKKCANSLDIDYHGLLRQFNYIFPLKLPNNVQEAPLFDDSFLARFFPLNDPILSLRSDKTIFLFQTR